jgi:hypothetical protein
MTRDAVFAASEPATDEKHKFKMIVKLTREKKNGFDIHFKHGRDKDYARRQCSS